MALSPEAKIMVYRGYVENGIIRLAEPVVLPEGAEVRVELASPAKGEFDPKRRRSKNRWPRCGGRSQGGMGPAAVRPERAPRPLHLRDPQIMRKVFADTLYWVAIVRPTILRAGGREARRAIGPASCDHR